MCRYVLVGDQWKYLYRNVDKLGQTVDFLLTAHRVAAAALQFLERAIDLHDVPKASAGENSANGLREGLHERDSVSFCCLLSSAHCVTWDSTCLGNPSHLRHQAGAARSTVHDQVTLAPPTCCKRAGLARFTWSVFKTM
jgi:hypothetical protein